MKTVTIVQRVLPHYRVAFFEALHHELAKAAIELKLIYGQEYPGTVPCSDSLDRPWAARIENRYLKIPFSRLVWQPCLGLLRDSDLIVLEQANSLLLNYWLIMNRGRHRYRLAFWGHGRNFQVSSRRSFRERLKRFFIHQVDWWFAYTEASAKVIRDSGFSSDKVTVVQNAIDTHELRTALAGVTQTDLSILRSHLSLPSEHVALYCGGMYADKQLDFLLAACHAIRQKIANFHVIFIGHGPEQSKIEQAAREHDWMHYVGPKFGQERAVYFKASQALLMPGLVGLAIVDSFIAETPLFTTDLPSHSPEISYLDHGSNGMITPFAIEDYAVAVAQFFESEELQKRLCEGCRRCGKVYTFNDFVERFASGLVGCMVAK